MTLLIQKVYKMSNSSSAYENLASKLLIISPVLASVSMNIETFVKHRELHSCLLMLNEINNGFIELNVDECERIGFPVIMPAPSLLPRVERFEAFIKERERLLTSVEENKCYI